jgi:hypothetical protein
MSTTGLVSRPPDPDAPEADAGEAPGVPTESAREIHELKRACV